MLEVALLRVENRLLHKSNEELSKRRMAKKTRILLGGPLTVSGGQEIIDQNDADDQL